MNPSLRLTPSNSPFFKHSTPKSPTKPRQIEEPGLRLRKIIGTTTASINTFDYLPSARCFAFTAGAAAVVASVDEDSNVSQKFFRAKPSATASNTNDGVSAWTTSPTPNESRQRAFGGSIGRQTLAASPLTASVRDWSDSPSGRSSTAKDRIKTATSVAISPDGKWLALGQTGYRPAILIFELKDQSSEIPLTVITEHSFGVHALSWSPDSRYLASLGTVNDGFLHVWVINEASGAAQLYASNKITTVTNDMVWIGQSIVTAGLRCVKVWRPDDAPEVEVNTDLKANLLSASRIRTDIRGSEYGNSIMSPRHKPLLGKNTLLNDMLEATFVAALPLSDTKAVLCAESGEICVLDDEAKNQILTPVASVAFCVSAARLDHKGSLTVLGAFGAHKTFLVDDLVDCAKPLDKRNRRQCASPNKALPGNSVTVVASAAFDDIVIEVTSDRVMTIKTCAEARPLIQKALPAHAEGVAGVVPICSSLNLSLSFVTFAVSGEVRVWDAQGSEIIRFKIPVESSQDIPEHANELKSVVPFDDGKYLATGDRLGVLSIARLESGQVITQIRAHSADIVDLSEYSLNDTQLLATAGRDRTVQLFTWDEERLELLQTLDEHAGAVTGLKFLSNGRRLVSWSSDRSVVIREVLRRDADNPRSLAYAMTRTIALKASPTSICAMPPSDTLLVATMDKSVGQFNMSTGRAGFSFRCADSEGGEVVIMSKIFYAPSLKGNPTIVGVSSTDKSVRLYTEYGSLVARDYGHTEGITSMCLIESQDVNREVLTQIVTVAADSTIFIWDSSSKSSAQRTNTEPSADENLNMIAPAALRPPLRKVLSFSELSRSKRERSAEEDQASPHTPSQPPSPRRLKKKTSRSSVMQPPKLEPPFQGSRRASLRQRSPSPPSPRHNSVKAKAKPRRASLAQLGVTVRSKSTDNVLTSVASSMGDNSENLASGKDRGYGGLTSSTESVCRNLRAYRKKLATSSASDKIAPEIARELEKEVKLTIRALAEKSQGKLLDEAVMTRLLDQASEKIVDLLDERIKERVQTEVRKNSADGAAQVPRLAPELEVVAEADHLDEMDAVTGVFSRTSI
ncbi:WD40 repeat-like protein [Polychaeton citri CBS 116435]|uniref:WD40 repeat-like protein n=1 Tax=Polychaeton citri CBS 116435 TaxID=1314669 RepID=A0A9P4Q9X6_9PEZI|nr:WD40 repeat-like protein [Polychaeton citri CBS 116435]